MSSSLVDLGVLEEWMDANGFPPGPLRDMTVLSGGTQNIHLRLRKGDGTYVFRRPPEHLRKGSNDVNRREARVLAALRDTRVPAPRLVASCPDETVLGAAFYVMEWVDGVSLEESRPAYAGDPNALFAMGLAAVDALATLGEVDHIAVGLGDFGRPDGFLERQVGRWLSELDSYRELSGYPGPDIPGLHEVSDWLDRNRPSGFRPGIMHGDYHMANLRFAPDEPRVAAILDWEMCTIGDPLLDLGWLIATCATEAASGLPKDSELAERYAGRSDRDLSTISWYATLACFKLGIVLEGTHARACAGRAEKSTGDRLHDQCLNLFRQAERFIRAE